MSKPLLSTLRPETYDRGMSEVIGAEAGQDGRNRVVAAAVALLARGGREALTTRAVAAAAGVQAPTIYRLFGDKQGLVDAVAELVKVGLLDASGRFVPEETAATLAPALADRLTVLSSTDRGQERVFVLHRPTPDAAPEDCVVLTQRDVRELQFAKAAIATGWTLLLEQLGLEHGDVQQVLLAGSFGSYLSPASAIRIGLVPTLPVLRIVSAGNVAGEGAKMALLSLRERTGAVTLLEEVEYVELSDRPDFNDKFVDQLSFP